MPTPAKARPQKKPSPWGAPAWVRGLITGVVAVTGLILCIFVCFFAMGAAAHSAWAFPVAVAFSYTVAIAIFVLSPGRASKGYDPFGPVVRRALGPLLRVHAVSLVPVIAAIYLRPVVWAHASPWWTTPRGPKHTTHLGSAEVFSVFLLLFLEGLRASTLLTDADIALQQEQKASRAAGRKARS